MNVGLVLVLFASIVTCCCGIRCYECTMTASGVGDPKCDDPFYEPEPPYLRDCDEEVYKKCRKTKMFLANDKISIVRACAEQTCSDEGCKTDGGQTVCDLCCVGDMCNGAGSLTFDIAMVASVMAAGLSFVLH